MNPEYLRLSLYALQVIAISVSVLVAALTYVRRQRLERAKWSQELFEQFYDDDDIKQVMRRLHHAKTSSMALLGRRVSDTSEDISDEEQIFVEQVDRFLNFLDFLVYLRRNEIIADEDIQSSFRHWFNIIGGGKYPELAKYVETFGFVNLKHLIKSKEFLPTGNRVTGL